jgi:hypothetical protein
LDNGASESAFWKGAAKVFQKVQDTSDQMSRFLLGSLRMPLANVLCGRGFAADRALGGNIQLGVDGPSLWMQAYVLPDHAAVLPQLTEQLNRHLQTLAESSGNVARTSGDDFEDARLNVKGESGNGNSLCSRQGPWGPKKEARKDTSAGAPVLHDLLDLDAGAAEPTASAVGNLAPASSALIDIDFLSDAGAGIKTGGGYVNAPLVESSLANEKHTAPAMSAFAFLDMQNNVTTSLDASTYASSLVNGQTQSVPDVSRGSPFAFIGASTGAAPATAPISLGNDELSALYASSSVASKPGGAGTPAADFSALRPGWAGYEPEALDADRKARLQNNKTLQAMESDLVANLFS